MDTKNLFKEIEVRNNEPIMLKEIIANRKANKEALRDSTLIVLLAAVVFLAAYLKG